MAASEDDPVTIRRAEAVCFRVPLEAPVITSFGRMLDRPAVFVRLEEEDGVVGWGEAWCNFPSVGAEHRARLVNDVLAPALVGRSFSKADEIFGDLTGRTAVLALQSGEHGPFAQAIAGLDVAAWDLFARRRGLPLWRMLGGTSPALDVYASGINPDGVRATAQRAAAGGHRAFKLKIGFAADRDLENLAALRGDFPDARLAADANQGWSLDEAIRSVPALEQFDLMWLEEPIRADHPWSDWRVLAERSAIPLAGGENISGLGAFRAAIEEEILQVIQPDLAKWGGVSMCVSVARAALAAGRRYCPHYLGGGIGLLASAHLLAAVGGDGLLEMDINPNPLRDDCCGPLQIVKDGRVHLTDEPGLGFAPDLGRLAAYRTL